MPDHTESKLREKQLRKEQLEKNSTPNRLQELKLESLLIKDETRFDALINCGFYKSFDSLHKKITEMEGNKNYAKALTFAKDLKEQLILAEIEFVCSGKTINDTVNDFKNRCDSALKTAHTELDIHRGWKKDFVECLSLLVSVITVIPFVIGCVRKLKHNDASMMFGLFKTPKTDSASKLDKIESSINTMFVQIARSADKDDAGMSMDF